MPSSQSESPESDSGLWTLSLVFLRLGVTAFGGPAAHIAMMEGDCGGIIDIRWS